MKEQDNTDIERRLNILEREIACLTRRLLEMEKGARQGLLQFVAAIEEFRGDEPRTADLRRAAHRDRMAAREIKQP